MIKKYLKKIFKKISYGVFFKVYGGIENSIEHSEDNRVKVKIITTENVIIPTQGFNTGNKNELLIEKLLKEVDVLKERLLLNHIIILRNLFGNEACVTLLLCRTQKEYLNTLRSFLLFLNMIREDELTEISLDDYALEILRKI